MLGFCPGDRHTIRAFWEKWLTFFDAIQGTLSTIALPQFSAGLMINSHFHLKGADLSHTLSKALVTNI